ncbi:hypothetical protein UB51_06305 [Paenibacillus sp. IHBB 10380]|nr:hypothetical protein UB51_06305 [Paenibacillus sp. IHBB 10380]
MRRYWFSILLSLFIIVGIGTYYVYGATDRLPEYKLSTIEGDVNEGAKIQLEGSYVGGRGSKVVSVTADGSDYQNRHSVYRDNFSNAARSWLNAESDIRQIIKDHRSFMRGKSYVGSLYKDEEWIIYADIYNDDVANSKVVLNIEILNLNSGKVNHFEPIVDGDSANSYVEDVQLVDDQIHILIVTYSVGEVDKSDQHNEYHDYVVDMNSGALTNNEILALGSKSKDNAKLYYSSITNATLSAPSDYALLLVREEEKEGNANQGRVLYDKYLYSYAYKTGKITALPDTLKTAGTVENGSYHLEGSVLSILGYKNDFINMLRFNLDTGKADKDVISITGQQLGADNIIRGIAKEDRLFILFHKNGIPMTAVVDVTNGDIVYKGEVVSDDEASESKEDMENVQLLSMKIAE